tara:strand:- start:5656 stop:5844 length:189 start_codon:yes stop_codon:yes gene_type:complete
MNLSNMKQVLIQIWAWTTALLFIIDFFIIAFLFTIILVVLLSPFIILIGIPVLIEELWKEKY